MKELENRGYSVFALENGSNSVSLDKFEPPQQLALILGTETTGVPKSVLSLAEGEIRIPQKGKKSSLNVAVATGIAAWHILNT